MARTVPCPVLAVFLGLVLTALCLGDDGLIPAPMPSKDKGGWPTGWQQAVHDGDYAVEFVRDDGKRVFKITGRKPEGRAAILFTTAPVFPCRACRLVFSCKRTGGVVDGFVRAMAGGEDAGTHSFPINAPEGQWTRIEETFPLPPKARSAGQVQLVLALYERGVGTALYGDISLVALTEFKPEIKMAVARDQLPLKPADGATVAMNPPDMAWPPQLDAVSYDLQVSQDPSFPKEGTVAVDGLPLSLYNHYSVFRPGKWLWRFRYRNSTGDVSAWSPAKSFVIDPHAALMPMPRVDDMIAHMPAHPRIYVSPESLGEFRNRANGPAREAWQAIRARADREMKLEMTPEPVFLRKDGGEDVVKSQQEVNAPTYQMTGRMMTAAFVYLVSGEKAYADSAKRVALALAKWDPNGATSYHNQDQAFRDIAWRMSVAYDWLFDALSPEERKTLLAAIHARAQVLFRDFKEDSRPLHVYPYDSHGITALGFLSIIAIATVGDIPDAEAWFRYVAPVYVNIFPPWGGDAGGWSQGVSYWKYSCNFGMQAMDAFWPALLVNLYKRPWARNNGYFKVYCHPPWCARSHFGDQNIIPPGASDAQALDRYASLYGDEYLKWYADTVGRPRRTGDLYEYFWFDDSVESKPPVDLPQSRLFPDIGWVAMHSDLAHPKETMLLLKSSPYGSCSHSHADQNHFVLYAYGEPLAIDAGYYDWYYSPHDLAFTRQTIAHNTITADGVGQPIGSIDACGAIEAFFTGPGFDHAVANAAPAYQGRLSEFTRRVLFVRPKYFVVIDDVASPQPSGFEWRLHSLERMNLDEGQASALISQGKARLRVSFLAPGKMFLRQDNKFPVRPGGRFADKADQWHLVATPPGKGLAERFLTVLYPFEEGMNVPMPALLDAPGAAAISIGEDAVVIRKRGGSGRYAAASLVSDAEIVAVNHLAEGRALFMWNGTELRSSGEVLLSADRPVRCAVQWQGEAVQAVFDCAAPTVVTFPSPARPEKVVVEGNAAELPEMTRPGRVEMRLAAGTTTIRINQPGLPPAPPAKLVLKQGSRTIVKGLRTVRSHGGQAVTFGTVDLDEAGFCDLEVVRGGQADPRMEVLLGREFIRDWESRVGENGTSVLCRKEMLLPQTRLPLWIRRSPETLIGEVRVRRSPMDPDAAAVAVEAPPASRPDVVRIEAEAFSAQGSGRSTVYTHRAFLSGGAGLSATAVGSWVEWNVTALREGDYHLIVKCATHETDVLRRISLDGKIVSAASKLPPSAGFGATPEEWQHVVASDRNGRAIRLHLSKGLHVVRIQALRGLLNMDCLLLVPAD